LTQPVLHCTPVVITSHQTDEPSAIHLPVTAMPPASCARLAITVVEIAIPAAATANLPPGSVVMDMVRTDLQPDRHLNFTLELPVVWPVTRGL
jgi:hypothetical protein